MKILKNIKKLENRAMVEKAIVEINYAKELAKRFRVQMNLD